jgi:PPOX class probable FMN-dependent enzyme
MSADPHALRSTESLRQIVGAESPAVRTKVWTELDETGLAFVARSPFVLFATADADGHPDVTPRGDHAGFVAASDARTLWLPERKGNRMVLALQNVLANPRVALIFLVPGTEETLRVHGNATLSADPEMCKRLSARGEPALLAIRVDVTRCFFHCAKAFKRSRLWQPETWAAPLRISFGKLLARRLGGGQELETAIDRAIEEDYEKNL